MAYTIGPVPPWNERALAQIDALLEREGLYREAHLNYLCAVYDESSDVIAAGGCFGNTLRCFAVDRRHQGEGLLNLLVTHLLEVQLARGNAHLFLYTKISAAPFFGDLGFFEIARVDDTLVFMENRRNGFGDYLKKLAGDKSEKPSAALVMNANPFTLGHQYLVEKAAGEWDTVHLFLVSEDASLIPFPVRKELVQAGVAHLPNVLVHDSGPYMISHATFPSYFLRERDPVIRAHALLDLAVFARIAEAMNIACRYVGDEPASRVTGLYNETMSQELPKAGIECRIVPRLEKLGQPVSASTVRRALQKNDYPALRQMVPPATYNYFLRAEAEPVLERLRQAGEVVHY